MDFTQLPSSHGGKTLSGLKTELWFGGPTGYKGKTVADVIEKNPKYIQWALGAVQGFYLNQEAQDALVQAIDGLSDRYYDERTYEDVDDTSSDLT